LGAPDLTLSLSRTTSWTAATLLILSCYLRPASPSNKRALSCRRHPPSSPLARPRPPLVLAKATSGYGLKHARLDHGVCAVPPCRPAPSRVQPGRCRLRSPADLFGAAHSLAPGCLRSLVVTNLLEGPLHSLAPKTGPTAARHCSRSRSGARRLLEPRPPCLEESCAHCSESAPFVSRERRRTGRTRSLRSSRSRRLSSSCRSRRGLRSLLDERTAAVLRAQAHH